MKPDDLLCSRNARAQKALVGRAQWEVNLAPFLRGNTRAWRERYRSFDARNEGQSGNSREREGEMA